MKALKQPSRQTYLLSYGEILPGLSLVGGDVLVGHKLPIGPLIDGRSRGGVPVGSGCEESHLWDGEDLNAHRLRVGHQVLVLLHIVQPLFD